MLSCTCSCEMFRSAIAAAGMPASSPPAHETFDLEVAERYRRSAYDGNRSRKFLRDRVHDGRALLPVAGKFLDSDQQKPCPPGFETTHAYRLARFLDGNNDVNERQLQLTEDLSGIFRGELHCEPLMLAAYASDASIFQVSPLGVARPIDRDDVVVLAKYAAESGTPLIARGAGTGVAGGAIGDGLIVDFSCHMNNVESIGDETVRVQPGVVRDRLNRILRPHGRYFPPDPSNTAVTTVGGMLAVDAAGSHSIRVGSTRDHVVSIETVLAGGTVVEFGEESLTPKQLEAAFVSETALDAQPASNGDAESAKRLIVERLASLLIENRDLILPQAAAAHPQCGRLLSAGRFGRLEAERAAAAGRLGGDARPVHFGHAAHVRAAAAPSRRAACCSAISSRQSRPCRKSPSRSRAPAT